MGQPDMFALEAFANTLGRGLAVRFECPRCGRIQVVATSAKELGEYGEVTLMCNNPKCTAHPSRPGYELCLRLKVESRMLGLHDQPLIE